MVMKKKNNNIIIISVLVVLSIVAIIIGGGLFSLLDKQDLGLTQFNGDLDSSWDDNLLKSDIVGINDKLKIKQYIISDYKEYSDVYCRSLNCNSITCYFDSYDFEDLYGCRVLSTIYQSKKIGGHTRSPTTDIINDCWQKFDVIYDDNTLYSKPIYTREKEEVYIPLEPKGDLIEKELHSYLNTSGYIDCPFFEGETVESCTNIYGSYIDSKVFLLEREELQSIQQRYVEIDNPPKPPNVGYWGLDSGSGEERRETGDYSWVIVNFKIDSYKQDSVCKMIVNDYELKLKEGSFMMNVSSSNDFYFGGENTTIDVTVYNNEGSNMKSEFKIIYVIPTNDGLNDGLITSSENLLYDKNTFNFNIPTYNGLDNVGVKVKGEIQVDNNFFSGLNKKCKEDDNYYPINECGNVSIISLGEKNIDFDIKKKEIISDYCLERGYDTISSCDKFVDDFINSYDVGVDEKMEFCFQIGYTNNDGCDEYIENNFNDMNLTLEEKTILVDNLEISLEEKTILIDSLETSLEEKTTLIDDLENKSNKYVTIFYVILVSFILITIVLFFGFKKK